ncbi:MAG: hypothetical protein QME74_08050, partial [Candidatus Edwardsbacteria bacterium]|nr:hypothetical protein [Candidatus Edwardsbacteria bacterium]
FEILRNRVRHIPSAIILVFAAAAFVVLGRLVPPFEFKDLQDQQALGRLDRTSIPLRTVNREQDCTCRFEVFRRI